MRGERILYIDYSFLFDTTIIWYDMGKLWTNVDSHVSSIWPLACKTWHVISSQAHLFSKYFLSVCRIQIQTSFQLNRKRRWTVNRAKGNIIIGGKLKHGTHHGSEGISNGLNTSLDFTVEWDWAKKQEKDGDLSYIKPRHPVSFCFLLLKHNVTNILCRIILNMKFFALCSFVIYGKWMCWYSFPHWLLSGLI